ncbi:MAG TPA: glycosyltransferase [Sphingomicrobium sp.]
MTHFAVFAPPLRGHLAPLSVLAEELIGRGHQVTFVHQKDARDLVDARGASFGPIGEDQPSIDRWTGPMARIRHALDLNGTMRRMEGFTTMFCAEAPALLHRLKVEAIISDQLEPAGGMVADHLRLPFVSVATALPMNREETVPPPFVNWSYSASRHGVKRNMGGWNITDLLMRSVNANIAANAKRLGISDRNRIEDCLSSLLQLAQIPRALDFPRSRLPQSFHYVGPFRRPSTGQSFLAADSRPTAYATFGTLQGSRLSIFERLAAACDALKIRLVIALGGPHRGKLPLLAGKPLVHEWVPQDLVMNEIDLVLCHGGMNTTLDALASGLPLLVMPMAFEQPGIAARVERSGAGLMASNRSQAMTFKKKIGRLLSERQFRKGALAMQGAIAASGGTKRAADLIERALSGAAPKGAATRARAARRDARDDSRSESRS